MTIFESVRRAMGGKKAATAADLGKFLASAANERDAARRRLESLRDADAEVALDDSKWKANGAAIADTEREIVRLDHVIARLQMDLEMAQAAEAANVAQERYASAETHAAGVANTIEPRLEEIGRLALDLIRDVTLAQAAINAANASKPAGAPELAGVEERVRSVPAVPDVTSVEVVERWAFADADSPLGPDWEALVVPDPGDPSRGHLIHPGSIVPPHIAEQRGIAASSGIRDAVVKRRFRRVTRVAGAPALRPNLLAEAISVPGFRYGEPAWVEPIAHGAYEPAAVVRRLEQLDLDRQSFRRVQNEPDGRVTVHYEVVRDD